MVSRYMLSNDQVEYLSSQKATITNLSQKEKITKLEVEQEIKIRDMQDKFEGLEKILKRLVEKD